MNSDDLMEDLSLKKGRLSLKKMGAVTSFIRSIYPEFGISKIESWAFEKSKLSDEEKKLLFSWYKGFLSRFQDLLCSPFPYPKFYLHLHQKALERIWRLIPEKAYGFHIESLRRCHENLEEKISKNPNLKKKVRKWLLQKNLSILALCPGSYRKIENVMETFFFHLYPIRATLFKGIFERISSSQTPLLQEENLERELIRFIERGGVSPGLEDLIGFLIKVRNEQLKGEEEVIELAALLQRVFLFAFRERFEGEVLKNNKKELIKQESRLFPSCKVLIEYYLYH